MPHISDVVRADHALIKKAFNRLIESDPARPRDATEFIWALGRFLIVEDLVVTPALEHHVARGGEAHCRVSDYDSVNTTLRHLQQLDKTDNAFEKELNAAWDELELHLAQEIVADLERLEKSMAWPDADRLGTKYERIRDLLQKPYGKEGTPDPETLAAILGTPRQELMLRIGVFG
ncbi:hypothetical protein B0T25DRAFT_569503 [Lasiosphaeria hispida]|uniref:Hemerythrin-like domain-containing protein n=1 Tax=Lasiosphaeria hispida TaxID=260671 RepID=A0AAJ0HDF2_9PEZI|nr:hypothetical protein B0T25DRAFT_569503 [Lasiosphaeria hispida]